MLRRGHRVFSFTYHSPSQVPGFTPYVGSEAELTGFLDRFERYFGYFFDELGSAAATPAEIKTLMRG